MHMGYIYGFENKVRQLKEINLWKPFYRNDNSNNENENGMNPFNMKRKVSLNKKVRLAIEKASMSAFKQFIEGKGLICNEFVVIKMLVNLY